MGSSSNKTSGAAKSKHGKTKSILLAAGELLSFERPHVAIKPESLENRFGPRGIFKTTFVFELVLQIAVALENLFEIVAGVCHAMLQLVHLMFDLLQTAKRSQRRLVDRRAWFEVNVLVQQAQLHVPRAHNVATIRCFFTSDETKDRALAGAVSTDQSNVFAGVHLK